MATITIPEKEYQKLLAKALRYEHLRQILEEDAFLPPPTKSANHIIKKLKATQKYNQKFLKSLSIGLKRSSYFKR